MKVFDCFTFNDEFEVIDLRFFELNKYISKFVVVESTKTHQGEDKKINFNINFFKKYQDKIIFLIHEPKSAYSRNKILSSWQKENEQRNYISNGLKNCLENDFIIISDADEIPNLKKINFSNLKKKVYVFEQMNMMYKFNLQRSDKKWLGSKLCKYKYLKSPQWLRSLKVHKKYSFFRFDKFFSKTYENSFEVIKDGGWHFGWLKKSQDIKKKILSFAHVELNKKKLKDLNYIESCIKKKINFLDGKKLKKINLDNNKFPNYFKKKKVKNWII